MSDLQFEPFFYYEGERDKPWRLPEDKAVIDLDRGFLSVADGVSRNGLDNKRKYPQDYLGGAAASIFTQSAHFLFDRFDYENGGMDDLLREVNKEIYKFNSAQGFDYKNPQKYYMGECVGVTAGIKNSTLYYGMLEDCYINVLRGDALKDQIKLDYQIRKAFRYAQKLVRENPKRDFENVWCNELRNNPNVNNEKGERAGWGSFNGEKTAEEFWQTGSIELQKGDIIWIVSDGMLPVLESDEIVNYIINEADNIGTRSQRELADLITEYGKQLGGKVKADKTADDMVDEKHEKTIVQVKAG
jgi:serine/threonine protein phosphatase PrpC